MFEKPYISLMAKITHPLVWRRFSKEWDDHVNWFKYLQEELRGGRIHVIVETLIDKFELDMNSYLVPQKRPRKSFSFVIIRAMNDEGIEAFLCNSTKGMFLISEELLWELFLYYGELYVDERGDDRWQ